MEEYSVNHSPPLRTTSDNHIRSFTDTGRISILDKKGRLENRDIIENLQRVMREHTDSDSGDVDEINEEGLTEHFVGGAYIRELFIPKDTTIVSRLWSKPRFWIIAYGDVTIKTETSIVRVQGPHTEIPSFGSKVALYTHEDTLWFAITGANSETPKEAESELTVDNYNDLRYPWDVLEHKGE